MLSTLETLVPPTTGFTSHCGSPHVHGLAWLPDVTVPDVQQVLNASDDSSAASKEALLQYINKVVSTINPAVLPDGSNVDKAPTLRPTPTSVICHTQKWRTLIRTWLTSLLPVSDTPVAQLPTAYSLVMANRSVDSAIRSLFSLK